MKHGALNRRNRSVLPLLALAAALTPVAGLGDDLVRAVAVQGKYAYVGINRSVVVVDVSDPRRPLPVGQTGYRPDVWSHGVHAVSVSGNYAFVVYEVCGSCVGRDDSLVIVDVSTPAAPRVIGSYPGHNDASGMTNVISPEAVSVAASGDYAYLYHRGGVIVLDVSQPAAPRRAGSWRSQHGGPRAGDTHRGSHISIVGNYAYVADSSGRLQVVDVSDPTAPKDVGSCASGLGGGLAVVGKHALLGRERCLRIIDLSDPTRPQVIGSYQEPADATPHEVAVAVAATGTHAFMPFDYMVDRPLDAAARRRAERATERPWKYPAGGLLVVDVSDPATPKRVFPEPESAPLVDGRVTALALQGDHAYLGAGPRLVVTDISDPQRPTVLGSAEVLPCKLTDVAVAGDYAFVASERGGLRVLDVSDAASPREVGSCLAPEVITTVGVAGDYAFAGAEGVLHVLNLSDPRSPREVAVYRTAAASADVEARPPEVAIVGKYACVTAGPRALSVLILDLSEPAASKQVSSYGTGYGMGVATYGDRLVALNKFNGTLRVIDLSDLAWRPWQPYLLPLAVVASIASAGVMFWGHRVLARYVVRRSENIRIRRKLPWALRKTGVVLPAFFPLALIVVVLPLAMLRLVPKAAPREVGCCALRGETVELAVAEQYAYVIGSERGRGPVLWVVDLSEPASPRRVGDCLLSETWGTVSAVAVAGKYVYLGNAHGLQVVEVADPAAPKVVGCYQDSIRSSGEVPKAIAVAGHYALVTHGQRGMRVFDVSDPTSPQPVGSYDSPLAP